MTPKTEAAGIVMALPLAGLLGLGLAGGAEAAVAGQGGWDPVVRGSAVQAPVAVEASDGGRRGDRDRERRRSRVYVRPWYGSFGWHGGFGSFWIHGYPPYGYVYGPYGWGSVPVGYADAGALDINTRPKKASVYIDGELVGRVDAFDGFPRYLWLRDGSYRIAIFMEDYETLERRIRVQPGVVIRIDEDLVPGTAERPRPAPPMPATGPPKPAAPPAAPEGEAWRVENRGRPIHPDQRQDPARLRVEVEPADAVVYLDGRLLGSGAELASLHSALIVDPGAHRLEAIRPGYVTEVRAFEAARGEDVSLRIVLREE